jgi:hypothetical protein
MVPGVFRQLIARQKFRVARGMQRTFDIQRAAIVRSQITDHSHTQESSNHGWSNCPHRNDTGILEKLGQGIWRRADQISSAQNKEEDGGCEKEVGEGKVKEVIVAFVSRA